MKWKVVDYSLTTSLQNRKLQKTALMANLNLCQVILVTRQAQIGHAHLSVKQSIRFDLCSTGMITVYKKATRRISLPAAGEQCSPVSQQPPSGQDHHISGMRHSPRQKSPSDRVQSKHSLKPCLSERQKENKQADMHFLPGSHSATLTICFDIH